MLGGEFGRDVLGAQVMKSFCGITWNADNNNSCFGAALRLYEVIRSGVLGGVGYAEVELETGVSLTRLYEFIKDNPREFQALCWSIPWMK